MRAECAAHVFKFFFCPALLLRAGKYKGGVRSRSRAKGGERVDRSTYVLCSRLTSSLGFAYRERERECALIYLGYIIVLVQLVL